MGCVGGKASTTAASPKEPLPSSLAAAPRGKIQSQLPPSEEGLRDFARIFFADQRKIFFLSPGMPSMRPLQPTGGPSSAHIGDLNVQVVQKAEALFTDSLKAQLEQACGQAADAEVLERFRKRAMAAMTVNVGIDFALSMNLMPTFLQPFFVILVSSDLKQARAATYGFVAQKPTHIVGDRPESKRTPFCVRLVSPNLLSEDSLKTWELDYSVREVRAATIMQAAEMDLPKLKESLSSGRWDE